MDSKTKGAWLLSQSKSLEQVTGAERLENIQYAGRAGRLFNLLRRNVSSGDTSTLSGIQVETICQLNGMDRSVRAAGLAELQRGGYVDVAANGAVSVLGATSSTVLEATAAIFEDSSPRAQERAVLDLSERVASLPALRKDVVEYVSDTHQLDKSSTGALIDFCKETALIDESTDRELVLLFNNNTFRDGQYAQKAHRLLQALSATEQQAFRELQEMMDRKGAVLDIEAQRILTPQLYKRVVGIGLFDRLEVSNSIEAVGYLTSPDNFHRYGRPFESDPVDDAKALLASLTYGMTRSASSRGQITMPRLLLSKLIDGGEVGGAYGATAIGEDYRELEKRQVVELIGRSSGRYAMRLLKKDVGELALTIIKGETASQEALLMDGSPAATFKGPAETRRAVRLKHTLNDKQFLTGALDRLRSGG